MIKDTSTYSSIYFVWRLHFTAFSFFSIYQIIYSPILLWCNLFPAHFSCCIFVINSSHHSFISLNLFLKLFSVFDRSVHSFFIYKYKTYYKTENIIFKKISRQWKVRQQIKRRKEKKLVTSNKVRRVFYLLRFDGATSRSVWWSC